MSTAPDDAPVTRAELKAELQDMKAELKADMEDQRVQLLERMEKVETNLFAPFATGPRVPRRG